MAGHTNICPGSIKKPVSLTKVLYIGMVSHKVSSPYFIFLNVLKIGEGEGGGVVTRISFCLLFITKGLIRLGKNILDTG